MKNIMDNAYYNEMVKNLDELLTCHPLQDKEIYVFGHCNATEELIELLSMKGLCVAGILDNNPSKQGNYYKRIRILSPEDFMDRETENASVCIVARANAAMTSQLRRMGFSGPVYKLVEYNSYAEYSFSAETLYRKKQRAERGIRLKEGLKRKYRNCFKIICPFSALGDVFLTMSYMPYFAERRGIDEKNIVYCVIGDACGQVVSIFGETNNVECFSQKDMDELVQACLYTNDADFFIAHQDRPYVVNLHRALYIKCIPLEQIYCCGVFGLPKETKPYRPTYWKPYRASSRIQKGKSVILSPYAKSVTALPSRVWEQIVEDYTERGFRCYTNVAGDERPLEGTLPVSPKLSEVQPLAEYAGTFIGIRSGLCDVLRYANCSKIALYPDYNYCDTKWKAIDMYALEGWENIVVKGNFAWGKH